MKNVINRAFMAKKRILFVLAAVGLFAASSFFDAEMIRNFCPFSMK